MATVITASHKVCDMCGQEEESFINGNGDKLTIGMGVIQSQSDRWEKSITLNITASIPYQPANDICVSCVKGAFELALESLENNQ